MPTLLSRREGSLAPEPRVEIGKLDSDPLPMHHSPTAEDQGACAPADLTTRRNRRRLASPLALVAVLALALALGCRADVGPCDEALARQVVYLEAERAALDGLPAFAGQALLDGSCGGGAFCHAADAADRFGTPAGLDFDVRLPCGNLEDPSECDDARLDASRAAVRRHAELIDASVRDGTMPPSGVGRDVLAVSRRYRLGPEKGSAPLPGVDTAEGRAILRNWLACGAPVVQRAEPEAEGHAPGDLCESGEGECRVRAGDGIGIPEPSWPSIYDRVIAPLCVRCHGEDEAVLAASELDLGQGLTTAHRALYRIPAAGSGALPSDASRACSDLDLLRIDTQRAEDSLLLTRLSESPPCGAPDHTLVPAGALAVVARWIECGAPLAPEDCP